MTTIWKFTKSLIILLVIVLLLWVILANYSVIFSKTVKGEIVAVEKNEVPVALMSRAMGDDMGRLLLFSIAIKGENGEIHTAASEERQWAVVRKGQCAEAVFLPHPPWDLKKKDTFFGARLVRLYDCPGGIPHAVEEPAHSEATDIVE